MNKEILDTEIKYTISLLKQSFLLLDKFGDGDYFESALSFCIYNGLERLLKIGIAIEKNEKINPSHDILELYKIFLGDDHFKNISASQGTKIEVNLDGSCVSEKFSNEYLLLSQINEFANAKTGRYKNLHNLFNLQEQPYIYLEKLLKEATVDVIVSNSSSLPKNTLHKIDNVYQDRILIVKQNLLKVLNNISNKYTTILQNKDQHIYCSVVQFINFVNERNRV